MRITLLLIQLASVSNANIWDGFHETQDDQQNDQEKKKYDAKDGYGVDIVRIFFVYGGLSKDGSTLNVLD